jgi:hypothetical protein
MKSAIQPVQNTEGMKQYLETFLIDIFENLHFNLPKSSIVHKRGTESELHVHYDSLSRSCKCYESTLP